MNKIFQIGFNKCGTSSIHTLFEKYTTPKLRSIHWDKGLLAKSMLHNIQNNVPLLANKYQEYDVFTDMETLFIDDGKLHIAHLYENFHILDNQYPFSKFILNTRNVDSWIKSRLKHTVVSILVGDKIRYLKKPILYWKLYSRYYNGLDQQSVVDLWIRQWKQHHTKVVEYFGKRPQDLLIYNIDNPTSMMEFKIFFNNLEFTVDHMPIVNKS